jgi:hypothetical protein
MHWRYGQWLREEAERRGQAVLPPRPYDTLLGRVLDRGAAGTSPADNQFPLDSSC